MKTRRFALGALAALASASLVPSQVRAETYPDKPIRLIVPFTPGGVTDNIGRVLAERMGRELGQGLVIDNRSGANGRIAQVMSSLSTPDRDTQLLMDLQPFCGEHRRKKVEEAAQLLRIIRLLPLLEDKPPAG